MKILLVQGSPHKKGSSNMLAEQFMEGQKRRDTPLAYLMPHTQISTPAMAVKPAEWRGTVYSMMTWRKPDSLFLVLI